MNRQDQTFATIGTLVVITQSVETLLDFLLTFVLQDRLPLTAERLMQLEKDHRKKTLGFFIKKMKERASFEDHLDDTLKRFLESRNTLIHRFGDVDGHELACAEDMKKVDTFLAQLYSDTMTVMTFCAALLHAWQEQTGIDDASMDDHKTPDTDVWIEGIKSMAQRIDTLVFTKED